MREILGSWLYRSVRSRIINSVYDQQEREGRPRDLEEVVEIGDKKLKNLHPWLYTFDIPTGIGVHMHGLYFPSPLTLAAFKDDLAVIAIWMRLGLGGACMKTVMSDAREGNKRPRLQEISVNGYDGLINAMGLPGHGVEGKTQELDNVLPTIPPDRPLGISIGGSSLEEYKSVFFKLLEYFREREDNFLLKNDRKESERRIYFEVNISCPNTPEGQQMTKHPELLEEILSYMRQKSDVVIGIKVSPDAPNDDLLKFAEIAKKFPGIYINAGNTTFRKCRQVDLPDDAISIGGGGLSGPALYRRTREMIDILVPTGLPIIATGGVDSADKVNELQDRGATLVGLATAVVKDPYCIPKMNKELAKRKI